MHEKRNFFLVLLLAAAAVWAVVAWWFLDPDTAPAFWAQRLTSAALVLGAAGCLVYALKFEDALPDHLGQVVGEIYYEADGLSFMPTVRVAGGTAELRVYYQNRYENPVNAIIHLRPLEESFVIQDGWRDVHFAFKAGGGDFGVIHQPILVPAHLRGEVINMQLAAASYYPRSHGARLRRRAGAPCGRLLVDWGGAAFRTGVHEVSGEIDLIHPATLHLPMPTVPETDAPAAGAWRQEQLQAGVHA